MGDVLRLPTPDLDPLWREAVGDVLRRSRQARGDRLRDVADRSGVSVQYLSEVERGLKEPSSEILAAVSGALGMTLLDLTVGVARSLQPAPATAAPGAVRGPRAMAG